MAIEGTRSEGTVGWHNDSWLKKTMQRQARGRTRGSTLHTYHETRAHSIHGRKARTLVEAGAWALPTVSWRIKYIKENKHTLWLVGGKDYAGVAGLGFQYRNSCETQSALMERRDPAGYREAALKQLWGEAYNGSDG